MINQELKGIKNYIQQLLLNIIDEISADHIPKSNKTINQLIKTTYHKNYNIMQGKCYNQHSENLCGYHAIFNTFCFLSLINDGSCQYNIENGGSFWKFKCKIQRFLLNFKESQKLKDQWPWKEKDIRTGDFQRVHNKICMQKLSDFSIFHKHQNFYYLNHIWSFQYNNLLLDHTSRDQLTNKFKIFRQYNGVKPIVLHLMLGITTHWMTFFATKINNKVQYWFFEPDQQNYLDYNEQQINQFIQRLNKDQIKYGRKQFTKFQKQSYSQCVKDIQKSLKLIIDCIEEKQNLHAYCYNRKFEVFAKHLLNSLQSPEQFSNVIRQYQFNVQSFFIQQIQWDLLSKQNTENLKKLMEYVSQYKDFSQQILFLFQFTQIHICP